MPSSELLLSRSFQFPRLSLSNNSTSRRFKVPSKTVTNLHGFVIPSFLRKSNISEFLSKSVKGEFPLEIITPLGEFTFFKDLRFLVFKLKLNALKDSKIIFRSAG